MKWEDNNWSDSCTYFIRFDLRYIKKNCINYIILKSIISDLYILQFLQYVCIVYIRRSTVWIKFRILV